MIYDVDGILITRGLGLEPLYEQFQKLPHFLEVEESWRAACALQYFGMPISKRETTLEEEFFYHLRAGDAALSLYWRLIVKALKRNDLEFFKRIGSAGQRSRGRPKAQERLNSVLLKGWLRQGLWLMSNRCRVNFIERVLGFRILGLSGLSDERVAKAVQRLKLLTWRRFPNIYLGPPLKCEIYEDGSWKLLFDAEIYRDARSSTFGSPSSPEGFH